ncbi:helix-turn-helix transcriptional regulator [Agromyces sp. NPDC057679]|uniref:helix-turn-helix transcriptional regulator n=1 Tax=Agromyces sp. NPDC057679 TaxID=3346207 RepID=UPI00366A6853
MPDLMTPEELAELVHSTPASLAQLRYRGGGPRFVRFGKKKVMYRREDVEEYLAANLYSRTDQPVSA